MGSSLDTKEQAAAHIERSITNEDELDHDEVYSYAEQRKIIHKVDRRLVSLCGVMYCVSLMDRTNLSAAAIAGMLVELKLIGNRYVRDLQDPSETSNLLEFQNIIVLIFFITYVLLQPPATILCRKIGPRTFLSTITLLWGCVMIGFGFVKSWEQMVGLRVLLGVFEAGFFPGCVYLLSTWYTRYDVQKRFSVFYLIGCVASAFAGILAYGLMQMSGLQGMRGWRW